MGATLALRELNDIPILAVVGKMDHSCSADITNVFLTCIDQGKYRIVIDLGEADGICYVGLGILVGGLKMLRKLSGDIKLARLRAHMLEAFRMTGMDGVFENFNTAEEAAESFLAGNVGM